ncbi:Exo_endo_phos domain-containing protein, partial [Cephalotus follicularis]
IDFAKTIESKREAFMEAAPLMRKSFSERQSTSGMEGLNLSNFDRSMAPETYIQDYRVFVATWNVGGRTPNNGLNLEDFLLMEGSADIYVCGFQEIVPLSAGNVLVIEDNEPAAKWLALISQALNKPRDETDLSPGSINSKDSKSQGSLLFFQKPSLKVLSKDFKADGSLLKTCNCPVDPTIHERWRQRKLSDPTISEVDNESYRPQHDSSVDDLFSMADISPSLCKPSQMSYHLIASKQMVGIFLSVWARKELVPYIGHLRTSSVGRGIMGYLGNKGCISISMSLHQTSFCFVCSHLASGEKDGDELKRNADVAEILKNTQFQKMCKNPTSRSPERIMDHHRIIWLGDLNYRMALSYDETRVLLEDNDWDSLLEKDQLNIEREAGRVFSGFNEERILFAPTYKYTHNSDSYAGETEKSKKKRRTPAWCDRILWRGDGIEQLSYIRGESRFSDHRPVCGVFQVGVEIIRNNNNRFRKGYSCAAARLEYEDCIPQRHSFYEY